jgi:tRNA (cytidine/uridine-2'-O-)-methyltransferase
MFEIILVEPEIPPNTGNVMRLAANTGCRLHLVRPLGFTLSDKQLERAGLDYRQRVALIIHDDWEACRATLPDRRLFAVSTRATQSYTAVEYQAGDGFVFGPETRGLTSALLATFPPTRQIRIPMRGDSRSLNLANAAAVVVYEAWRQSGFNGGA